MRVPEFIEAQHPLIQALADQSDRELVYRFQRHPDQGQYFVAIFCRYAGLPYVLIRNMARASLQTDYLFAKIWRNIFFELTYLDPGEPDETSEEFSLQTWIFNKTALCINQEETPSVETIQYTLGVASPPLWCYIQTALDQLQPQHRLVLVLSQTFHWSDARIAGFLEAEGEPLELTEIAQLKSEAFSRLGELLPQDIQVIYFESQTSSKAPVAENANLAANP
jgi:hypothetical protein